MLDKNGIEIKTGDIVEITGAFFKNDNGLYFVEHSAGDADWCGKDHSLRKISKKGKISTARGNVAFWPLMITVSSPWKRAEAHEWNAQHATIEVKTEISRLEVAEHFKEKSSGMDAEIQRLTWNFGEENGCVADAKRIKAHYENVAAAILAAC